MAAVPKEPKEKAPKAAEPKAKATVQPTINAAFAAAAASAAAAATHAATDAGDGDFKFSPSQLRDWLRPVQESLATLSKVRIFFFQRCLREHDFFFFLINYMKILVAVRWTGTAHP